VQRYLSTKAITVELMLRCVLRPMARPDFCGYTFVSVFEVKLGRLCLSACTSVAYTSVIGVPIGFNLYDRWVISK